MPADPRSWITDLFHQALAIEPTARDAFLNDACRGDRQLEKELSRLLAAHASGDSFLDRPVVALADPPRLIPGTRLGAYSITAFIGAGGMGDVYRAHDPRLGRDVAMEILPPEGAADADRRARFGARHARSPRSITPTSSRFIRSSRARTCTFSTMELVEGKTVRELIPRGGMPIDRLLEIGIALTDANGTAHALQVVHRDVKPANVMLTAEGRVKVLDFGIAPADGPRDLGRLDGFSPGDYSRRTRVGHARVHVAGAGRGPRGRPPHRHLLARRRAVRDGHRPAPVHRRVERIVARVDPEGRAPDGHRVAAGIAAGVGRLIGRCLAKEPGRRYQSAIDLRNESKRSSATSGTAVCRPPGATALLRRGAEPTGHGGSRPACCSGARPLRHTSPGSDRIRPLQGFYDQRLHRPPASE